MAAVTRETRDTVDTGRGEPPAPPAPASKAPPSPPRPAPAPSAPLPLKTSTPSTAFAPPKPQTTGAGPLPQGHPTPPTGFAAMGSASLGPATPPGAFASTNAFPNQMQGPMAQPFASPYGTAPAPPLAAIPSSPSVGAMGGAIPGPPPSAPGTARLGNTGQLPVLGPVAMPAVAPHGSNPMYPPIPTHAMPRITVQYPKVGSTLVSARGSYAVRDVIGSGEFGAVYEAIGPFDQIYALKMVRPANRPYAEVQAEWAKEVQRMFSLRHPNVVYIYDSFEHNHLFFLALERCDHALKAMLGTPMQEGLVIEMSRQLLAAVQFLHDNDVVHDDLHAGNVLITHTDRLSVKIADFGISNELRGMAATRPNVVHHAIMAPEILATGYTSRQSDLYQVGLLVYWMFTGEPAMQMDVPYEVLCTQIAEGEPRKRAESLGTPLGALIAKMLRRRETFRYTSAREVWADLRELPAWKQRNLFPAR